MAHVAYDVVSRRERERRRDLIRPSTDLRKEVGYMVRFALQEYYYGCIF